MCRAPKPKTPEMPAPPPQVNQQGAAAAADREKKRLRASAGHKGTIMTGSTGLQTQANVGKTVLGG